MLVSRFMTRKPVTVAPEAPLEEATVLMERHGFRHLPVVTGHEVVGMLSDRDLRLGTGGHPLASLNLPEDGKTLTLTPVTDPSRSRKDRVR